MVLQRFFHVKKKINKPAHIQAFNGVRKKRTTFPVNILDVTQKAALIFRSKNTNSLN